MTRGAELRTVASVLESANKIIAASHGTLKANSVAAYLIHQVGIAASHGKEPAGLGKLHRQLVFIGQIYDIPRHVARQRGETLLVKMGLGNKSDKHAKTLSRGMQRRINLIMALVHDPDILVLDEQEAGLDPQSRIHVRE